MQYPITTDKIKLLVYVILAEEQKEGLQMNKRRLLCAFLVMVAHISVPNIIGDNTPCTLSYKMITEILRGDLEYDGLVITDAMNMGVITEKYSSETATIMAIKAGADLILMPENFESAAKSVLAAVANDEINEARIDESVRRIIKAKLNTEQYRQIVR